MSDFATSPANAHASVAARDLLGYIHALPKRAERCVLSGHFIRWNHNASLDEISSIRAKTGQWVAIAAGDYYTNDQMAAHPCDPRRTNAVLKAYARLGGLVSVSVHMNNPASGGPAWDRMIDLRQVITNGTPAQRDFAAQLTVIGDGLEELRQSSIPVIFRPFHEMTGGWFWWGDKDRDCFRAMWRVMFEYLCNERRLDNLLWAYTPAAGMGDPLRYYPGDALVDLVGLDAYTPNPNHLVPAYEALLATGKPFGFGEYGPVGGAAKSAEGDYDWSQFALALRRDFPIACYFITWRDHWGMDHHRDPGALLNDGRIVNREQLPR